jgi:hypothetical protein
VSAVKMNKLIGRRSAGIRRLALAGLAAALGVLPGCDDSSQPDVPAIIPIPNSIAVADINGDGTKDLLVATTADIGNSQNPGYANVILNTLGKLGTFQPGVGYRTTGSNPSSIAVANLTGSGALDLVVANFGSGSVSVLLHDSTPGTFKPAVDVSTGGMPNQIVIADLNNDGKPDLVLADMSSSGNVIVLMANPSSPGQFQAPVNLPTKNVTPSVAVGDLNGDGAPDIVAATFDVSGNNGAVYVFMQDPAHRGSFLAPMVYPAGAQPQSVKIADVNRDGLPDIVVANQGPGTDGKGTAGVSVLLQNAAHPGTFLAPVTFSTPGFAIDVAVADLNDDGRPDLVVANLNPPPTGSVSVLLQLPPPPGSPGIAFGNATSYAGLGQPLSVVIEDLNGDGHPDIAVADGISATVLFQDAASPGTFAQAVQVGSSPPPY